MNRRIARRLKTDADWQRSMIKLARDYVEAGEKSTAYWTEEFDAVHDLLMAYAPLTSHDLEALEKGHPKRFILPVTATQLTTMTTFIAQVLFGDAQPHRVVGRGPEDEVPAEHMNQLLRWNAEQQQTYLLGYLWVMDALTFNRGIMYDSWEPIWKTAVSSIEANDPSFVDANGIPIGFKELKRERQVVGGYNKIFLVSPYEFICDPALPLHRLQEHRFCGHRCTVPWNDLRHRAELDEEHPSYVLPDAVEALKKKKGKKSSTPVGATAHVTGMIGDKRVSRSQFERTKTQTGLPSPLGAVTKDDPGTVDMHEIWIRLVPKDYGLGNSDLPTIFQFLVGNRDVILAINEAPNQHELYPYSVAEGRPNAFYQGSPGWAMMLKPLQDYIDYFKNRRQQSLARTSGNIFIAKSDKVNLTDFLDPDKDGLVIPVLPEAASEPLNDIIRQVPVQDTTRGFHSEMLDFVSFSETVTGANANMQGQVEGDGTATEFAGTQQMSAGRMSSIARLISVQGIQPQTRRFVENFQQFMSDEMALRFVPGDMGAIGLGLPTSVTIDRDSIQGLFDYVVHDGTLPGTDGRKVAAMTRLVELVAVVPQIFEPAPGNIDLRAVILSIAKAAGVNVENFQYRTNQQPMAGGPEPILPDPGVPPNYPQDPAGFAASPGLGVPQGPGRPREPSPLELPTVGPPQVRPANFQ